MCQKCIILLLLWICCILLKAHSFIPHFLPTTISLTLHFRRKRKVRLHFLQKTHSYEDNAKFHSSILATMLSYAMCFRRKRGMIKNYEDLAKFEDFWKCWLYCVLYLLVIERCKKSLKNRLRKSRACVPWMNAVICSKYGFKFSYVLAHSRHNYRHRSSLVLTVSYLLWVQEVNNFLSFYLKKIPYPMALKKLKLSFNGGMFSDKTA
jgi:hypothetical protein